MSLEKLFMMSLICSCAAADVGLGPVIPGIIVQAERVLDSFLVLFPRWVPEERSLLGVADLIFTL